MRRGRHKIFIGMAPGVGKTYKMLEEGYNLRKQGTDVVIGLLETHGRKETAEKAQSLESVPRKMLLNEGFILFFKKYIILGKGIVYVVKRQ